MAFPVVEAIQSTQQGSLSPRFNLPSGIVTGELLVACITWRSDNLPATVTTSGWTELTRSTSGSSNSASVLILYREATGTDGSFVELSMGDNNTQHGFVLRISGWDDATAPLAASSTSESTKLTTVAMPVRSYGWSNDTLAISGIGMRDDKPVLTGPSGYTLEATNDRHRLYVLAEAGASPIDPGNLVFDAADEEVAPYTIVIPGVSAGGGDPTGIKVYNGSSFVEKPVKYYNGSSFTAKALKRWNGSSWV